MSSNLEKILGLPRIGNISLKKSFNILDFINSFGYLAVDTAPTYPNSENFIGKYLKANPNANLRIYTKFGRNLEKMTVDDVKKSLEESLNRLSTKSIYGFAFHNTPMSIIDEHVIKYLYSLRDVGVIKKIGWCGNWKNFEPKKSNLFDYLMLPINPYIEDLNIHTHALKSKVIAINPFANFFWKYKPWNKFLNHFNENIRKRFNPLPPYDKSFVNKPMEMEELLKFIIQKSYVNGICFGSINVQHITEVISCLNRLDPRNEFENN